MFNVSSFLEKFKQLDKKRYELKKCVIESVKKHTNIELEEASIYIKYNTIVIKESPSVRNEIYFFKDKILSDICRFDPSIKNIK